MMGHGKHCECGMCKLARATHMMGNCTDERCGDPHHDHAQIPPKSDK